MATTSGTVTGHDALLTSLRTFLTTNADLVSASQTWTVLKEETISGNRYIYFRGPGLAGTDEIFVNIRSFEDTAAGRYNWEIRGATGFNTNLSFDSQPGVTPKSGNESITFVSWQFSLPYWFVANGRRFIVVTQLSSTWSTVHGGFILPYATSGEFSYPNYIASTCGNLTYTPSTPDDFHMGSFFNPSVETISTNPVFARGAAYLSDFSNVWQHVFNYTTFGSVPLTSGAGQGLVWPYAPGYRSTNNIKDNHDGGFTFFPSIISSNQNDGNVFGEIEGVYGVSGFNNAASNTAVINSENYLIIPTWNRIGNHEFAAIRLS